MYACCMANLSMADAAPAPAIARITDENSDDVESGGQKAQQIRGQEPHLGPQERAVHADGGTSRDAQREDREHGAEGFELLGTKPGGQEPDERGGDAEGGGAARESGAERDVEDGLIETDGLGRALDLDLVVVLREQLGERRSDRRHEGDEEKRNEIGVGQERGAEHAGEQDLKCRGEGDLQRSDEVVPERASQ
ncbi:MAG: hypothetical protein DMD83_01995 [Candidatus Rokuibacteriota bacterium]|nr:MAG: hypothetical protein DMD83_01995 [Candidatus Rokubacteria bacterium]